MLTALKIQWEPEGGIRANGAIVVKGDRGLMAKGGSAWQHTDGENSYEIRMIDDDRDVSQYENIEGIEILRGVDEINAALDQLEADQPARFDVDEQVVLAALQNNDYPEYGDLRRLAGKKLRDIAEELWNDDVPGVIKKKKTVPRLSQNGKLRHPLAENVE